MHPSQAILKKGHIDVTGMWRRLWADAKAKALAAHSKRDSGKRYKRHGLQCRQFVKLSGTRYHLKGLEYDLV